MTHRARSVVVALPAASPVGRAFSAPFRPAAIVLAALVVLVFAAAVASAQQAAAGRQAAGLAAPADVVALFSEIDSVPPPVAAMEPRVRPARYRPVLVDVAQVAGLLARTPAEFSREAIAGGGTVVELPHPDGVQSLFRLVESAVMAPDLAARYPQIRTYLGRAVDDPSVVARVSVTPRGLHAQVFDHGGAWYVDPYSLNEPSVHTSYWRKDLAVRHAFACLAQGRDQGADPVGLLDPFATEAKAPRGINGNLKTYRAAISTTGEYSQFHGGNVPDVLAEIVVALNRVTGIYEVDFGIRFQLVANNDLLIFLNAGSDPFSNGDAFSLINQNPTAINNAIGLNAYDIGHNFSTGGGGLASLRVVCTTSKAAGITGLPAPVGDPFYVDYVAHEMGHQFGGNHSFNGVSGSCSGGNRNASTAFEPGSGSTIMAYAGICGADDIQPNSDPFFHSVSLDEINAFVAGTGGGCAVVTNTGNLDPTVSAGPDFAIPAGTPFALTAVGSDPDDDTLTYSWEQRDLGPSQSLAAADNGSSPLFIARPPTADPTRFFPRFADVLSGASNPREELPAVGRAMDFRVVARDSRGGTDSDDLVLNVIGTAGPFRITSPAQGSVASGLATVLWDVAGTDAGAINCQSVNILLSLDNGQTFPTALASDAPNTGSAVVTLPAINNASARVMIEAVDNVFFAVSRTFTVEPAALLIALVDPPQAVAPGVPTPVEVTISSSGVAIDPSSPALFVSVDGGPFNPFPLTQADSDTWTGALPPVLCDSTLSYFASARTVLGLTETSPGGGASDPVDATVGFPDTAFEDSFVTNDGWTVSGNATDGQWTRGTPAGGGDRSDPPASFDGDGICWVTDNADGNSDVDSGSTTLTSPVFDFTGGGTITYAYWYDDGAGAPADAGDGYRVETSRDGGATWRTEVLYTATAFAWRTDTRAIPDELAGPNFRVRFTVSDVNAGSLIEGGLDAFLAESTGCENPPNCPADIAPAFGNLDANDIIDFVNAFNTNNLVADISPPGGDGLVNVNDVIEFVNAFNAGCP